MASSFIHSHNFLWYVIAYLVAIVSITGHKITTIDV